MYVMSIARKIRVTFSLSPDVIRQLEQKARATGASRSSTLEALLRSGDKNDRARELERQTAAYYESLTADERRDESAYASWSSGSARRVVAATERQLAARPSRKHRA